MTHNYIEKEKLVHINWECIRDIVRSRNNVDTPPPTGPMSREIGDLMYRLFTHEEKKLYDIGMEKVQAALSRRLSVEDYSIDEQYVLLCEHNGLVDIPLVTVHPNGDRAALEVLENLHGLNLILAVYLYEQQQATRAFTFAARQFVWRTHEPAGMSVDERTRKAFAAAEAMRKAASYTATLSPTGAVYDHRRAVAARWGTVLYANSDTEGPEDFDDLFDEAEDAGSDGEADAGSATSGLSDAGTQSQLALAMREFAVPAHHPRNAPEARSRKAAEDRRALVKQTKKELGLAGHLDWDDEDDGEELPDEVVFPDEVSRERLDAVLDRDDAGLRSFYQSQAGLTLPNPVSDEGVKLTLTNMRDSAMAVGGAVYYLDNGAPVTPALMSALAKHLGSEGMSALRGRLRTIPRVRGNLLTVPIPEAELRGISMALTRPGARFIKNVFQAWGIPTLAEIAVPALKERVITITSPFTGEKVNKKTQSPYWFIDTVMAASGKDAMKEAMKKIAANSVLPATDPRLFGRSADMGVLRTMHGVAVAAAQAGVAGPVEFWDYAVKVARASILGTGRVNGLAGRVATSLNIARDEKSPPDVPVNPLTGSSPTKNWSLGAYPGTYELYKQIMRLYLPAGSSGDLFMVTADLLGNLMYATGVDLLTGETVSTPASPPLMRLALGSEAGILQHGASKEQTLFDDMDAARKIVLAYNKADADQRNVLNNALRVCAAKPKSEVGKIAKFGGASPNSVHGLVGPASDPDAKWRFIFPINAAVNYPLAQFLSPVLKNFKPIGDSWQPEYITPINHDTTLSFVGWSPFKRGLQNLIDSMVARRRGFLVYSDNFYYYELASDGQFLDLISMDIASMEVAVKAGDISNLMRYFAEEVWGVKVARNAGGAFEIVGNEHMSPAVALFAIRDFPTLVTELRTVFGNLQYTTPGEGSGQQATGVSNTGKTIVGVATYIMLVNGDSDFQMRDGVDYNPDHHAQQLVSAFALNGMKFTIENRAQIPVSREAIENSVGDTIITDLLGMDIFVHAFPGQDAACWPVLNRARRVRAELFVKSHPVKTTERDPELISATAAAITIVKTSGLYLMGGWSDEGEAAALHALVTNARETIKGALRLPDDAELFRILNGVVGELEDEAPADNMFAPIVPILRGSTLPSMYDVIALLDSDDSAAAAMAMLYAQLERANADTDTMIAMMVKFGGIELARSFPYPDPRRFDDLLARVLEAGPSMDVSADQLNVLNAIASRVGGGARTPVQGDQEPEDEAPVPPDVAARAKTEALKRFAKQRANEVVVAKVTPSATPNPARAEASDDPGRKLTTYDGASEEKWKGLGQRERTAARVRAAANVKLLLTHLPPTEARLLSTMKVTSTSEAAIKTATARLAADINVGAAQIGGSAVNVHAYQKAFEANNLHLRFEVVGKKAVDAFNDARSTVFRSLAKRKAVEGVG